VPEICRLSFFRTLLFSPHLSLSIRSCLPRVLVCLRACTPGAAERLQVRRLVDRTREEGRRASNQTHGFDWFVDVAVEIKGRRYLNSSPALLFSRLLPSLSFTNISTAYRTQGMISSRGMRSPPRAVSARNPAMQAKAAPAIGAGAARRSLACSAAAAVPSVGRPDAQVVTVLGTQWGDEGKGKLVDILARDFDVVARAQVRRREREEGERGEERGGGGEEVEREEEEQKRNEQKNKTHQEKLFLPFSTSSPSSRAAPTPATPSTTTRERSTSSTSSPRASSTRGRPASSATASSSTCQGCSRSWTTSSGRGSPPPGGSRCPTGRTCSSGSTRPWTAPARRS